MKQTIIMCVLFVTTFSATAFAKSGMPMINTKSLYLKICGSTTQKCKDSAVYRGFEYDVKFLNLDPKKSKTLEHILQMKMDSDRTTRTKVVGPMTAVIAISRDENSSTGRKTLYVVDESDIDLFIK